MIQAGVPVHELLKPNTSIKLLGWLFDTKTMKIKCPPERKQWAEDIIRSAAKGCNLKMLQSSAGVLEFLAQGLPFLKAPLGWLHRKIANYKALSTEGLDDLKDRFIHYMRYVQKLLEDWNGSASIYIATSTTQPDMIIYSDASGSKGFGYLDLNSLQYGFGKWSQKDLKQAHRESKTSSTFLEILAIAIAIKSLGKKNTAVEIICDSQPAVFALERRYYKGAIDGQNIIIGLDKYCRDTGIATFYKHQPREDPNIKLVDALSKGTIPEGLKINGTLTKNQRVQVYSEECA
jgi:ribonuclease HI